MYVTNAMRKTIRDLEGKLHSQRRAGGAWRAGWSAAIVSSTLNILRIYEYRSADIDSACYEGY